MGASAQVIMFIPDDEATALALALTSMLCWGSYSIFMVFARPRISFELFYLHYVIGSLIITVARGFTLGRLESGGPGGKRSFIDDFKDVLPERYLYAAVA